MSNKNELASKLDSVELVVQDTNKFKIKLGIGEDAFKTLTIKNNLTKIWELKGAAAAGAEAGTGARARARAGGWDTIG